MKLIITILSDDDWEPVSRALIENDLRVTRIASTGGFFRRGSSTLMIGIEKEKVEQAIDLIRNSISPAIDPNIKRATLFVLNVEDYSQI
jgi:uncharacterized protein YaaQ